MDVIKERRKETYCFYKNNLQNTFQPAGVSIGAPSSFQLGISSSKARVSKTFPDIICAPTSEAFSTTQTLISLPLAYGFHQPNILEKEKKRKTHLGQLFKPYGSSKTSWSSPNGHNVIVHCISRG